MQGLHGLSCTTYCLVLPLPSCLQTRVAKITDQIAVPPPVFFLLCLSGNFSGTKKTEEIMVARGSMLELLRIDPDTDKLVSSALQTAGLCYTRCLSNCTSSFHKFMLWRPSSQQYRVCVFSWFLSR